MSEITTSDRINQLFNFLDQFHMLPAYQLERRADIFFTLYLKEILEKHFQPVTIHSFIPEFPLKIDRITPGGNPSNLSNKVDYLAVSLESKKIFLVELKTESTSLRTTQHDYLQNAKKNGLTVILNDLYAINKASRHKKKYAVLLQYLQGLKLIDKDNKPILDNNFTVEIVYIIPSIKTSVNLASGDSAIITFAECIELIKQHPDDLSQRFIKSLDKWIPDSDKQ